MTPPTPPYRSSRTCPRTARTARTTRIARPPRAAGALVAALLVVGACSPPDRPTQLASPLPDTFLDRIQPDEVLNVRVAPGVWYRYVRSPEGPMAMHLVEAELDRCELGLDVTRAAREEGKTGGHSSVSELAGGVLVAVNGDFFTPEGAPLGPEADSGRFRTRRARPAMAWWPGRVGPWIGTASVEGDTVRVGRAFDVDAPPRELEVVGGFPQLLEAGEPVGDLLLADNPTFSGSRHPRTAVAWDPAVRKLWLVVVDGRQASYSAGMTLAELAGALRALGAREALNLDGGGSSAMVVRGRRVSRPSDEGGERPVVNVLTLRRDEARYCAPDRSAPGTAAGPHGRSR